MSWNYRVLRRLSENSGGITTAEYSVYEVYYDDAGVPTMCTDDPAFPSGSTPEELLEDAKHYAAAFNMPILDWHAFGSPTGDVK